MRRHLFTLLLAASLAGPVRCQVVALSLTGGATIPNKPEWDYILAPAWGVNADIAWPARVEDSARAPFALGLRGSCACIPGGIAGSRFGLQGVVTMPLVTDRLELGLAAGLGLYTRPEERTADPENLFIGSYLNCAIDIGIRYLHPLPDGRHTILAGLSFVHNSNGYLRKPNEGLNYLQCEAGCRLSPARRTDTLCFSGRRAVSAPFVTAALGLSVPRHAYAPNGTFYPAYMFQAGYRRAIHPCRSLALTLDASYNFAEYYPFRQAGLAAPVPLLLGTSLMYETHWGPISLRTALGAHLYKSNKDYPIYERVGIFYHLPDPRHSIGVALRAYYAHIDFIEWSYSLDLTK